MHNDNVWTIERPILLNGVAWVITSDHTQRKLSVQFRGPSGDGPVFKTIHVSPARVGTLAMDHGIFTDAHSYSVGSYREVKPIPVYEQIETIVDSFLKRRTPDGVYGYLIEMQAGWYKVMTIGGRKFIVRSTEHGWSVQQDRPDVFIQGVDRELIEAARLAVDNVYASGDGI